MILKKFTTLCSDNPKNTRTTCQRHLMREIWLKTSKLTKNTSDQTENFLLWPNGA